MWPTLSAIQRGESYCNMGHGMRCLAFSFLQRVLDLSYWQTILHMMSWRVVLLGWITVQEAREYYRKIKKLIVRHSQSRWRERKVENSWTMYILHRDYEALCQTLKIPATPDLTKHQLDFWGKGWKPSTTKAAFIYTESGSSVPNRVTGVSKLPVGTLRVILSYLNTLPCVPKTSYIYSVSRPFIARRVHCNNVGQRTPKTQGHH